MGSTGFPRWGRLRAVALACAVGLSAVAVPLGARAAAASTPTCSTANLRVDRVGGQGFMSHREWDLALRNTGTSPCELQGFPTVVLLDGHARRESVRVVHHGGSGGPVVLAPWQPAYFSFVYVVSGPCLPHFFSAYGLSVTPPGTTGRLAYYAGRYDVCSVSLGGHPTVTAVSSRVGP